MSYLFYYLFIFIFLTHFADRNSPIIVSSCPDYPTPINLDHNIKLLSDAYQMVEEMIQTNMSVYGIQSFVASAVYLDQMVWSQAFGKLDPLDENSPPLTIDDNIRLASITKVFTDLMMFQLRDKGMLSLDDEVSQWNSKFSILNPYPTKRGITLRELSSHQSGLPREIPCPTGTLGTPNCTEDIIYKKLSKQFLILPQYSTTHYSNLGVSLLGRTLQKVINDNNNGDDTDYDYEKYIHDHILSPLGMLNTTFDYESIKYKLASGLLETQNGSYVNAPVLPLGWGAPAGGLFSTARDMARFMIFWLNNNDTSLFDILNPSTKNEALEAISLIQDGSSAYGTPFEMYYNQDNQIWMKAKLGIQQGYTVNMVLVPSLRLGLFFGATLNFNTDDVFTTDALNILLPVYTKLLHENGAQPQHSAESHKDQHQQQTISYLGTYSDSIGNRMRIGLNNNRMIGQYNGVYYKLETFSDDFPLVQRIHLTNTNQMDCKSLVDGYNYELIYFTVSNENPNQCDSVMIAGQTLNLLSTNPSYDEDIY